MNDPKAINFDTRREARIAAGWYNINVAPDFRYRIRASRGMKVRKSRNGKAYNVAHTWHVVREAR